MTLGYGPLLRAHVAGQWEDVETVHNVETADVTHVWPTRELRADVTLSNGHRTTVRVWPAGFAAVIVKGDRLPSERETAAAFVAAALGNPATLR